MKYTTSAMYPTYQLAAAAASLIPQPFPSLVIRKNETIGTFFLLQKFMLLNDILPNLFHWHMNNTTAGAAATTTGISFPHSLCLGKFALLLSHSLVCSSTSSFHNFFPPPTTFC